MTNHLHPESLLKVIRGNATENLHSGWICVVDSNQKVIFKRGNINDFIFLRSVSKPIQALSVIDNNISVTQKELAIISGSHTGSKECLDTLKSLLKKQDLDLKSLQCGIHLPFDTKASAKLLNQKKSPSTLHNNCSGKHIGMLCACKKNNWSLKNYLNKNHPIQKLVLKNIKTLSEAKKIYTAIDGCGVPTFSIPIINIAKMFSNLTKDKNHEYYKVVRAMQKYPYFMGGENRLDSEIIKASNGKLISKVGAEGIVIAAFNGNCTVVKIADGSQTARSIVMLKLLLKLKWLKESDIKGSPLKDILTKATTNLQGKTVCKLITNF